MHDGSARPRLPVGGRPHRSFATGHNTTDKKETRKCSTRTASNNGHNGNNGNGTGNGLVQVNGNGHKPGAAIVSEHELLWDGLSPAVSQALGQPLDPALASQRKGRAGRSYDYLEGHVVIEQANRIFGYGGWGYELAGGAPRRAA